MGVRSRWRLKRSMNSPRGRVCAPLYQGHLPLPDGSSQNRKLSRNGLVGDPHAELCQPRRQSDEKSLVFLSC
jgi:hypothetical protein